MIWSVVRKILSIFLLGSMLFVATLCTPLGLKYASLEVESKPEAAPALTAASLSEWQQEIRPRLMEQLQDSIYGHVPVGLQSRILSKRVVDPTFLDKRAVLEEWQIEIFDDRGASRSFNLAIVLPSQSTGAAPIILAQSFCDNRLVLKRTDLAGPLDGYPSPCISEKVRGSAIANSTFMYIMGEYIAAAPIEQYIKRGFAFANFYASDIVPDNAKRAPALLASFPGDETGERPMGAIAAWASSFSVALDHLEGDARIDATRTAIMGHSRHGKAALVASAWDTRIEAVISMQSGTGGASLNRQKAGESIHQITKTYPHWFAPSYKEFSGHEADLPFDQHALLALSAPRRVMLTNGRRDVWSDPNGAFRSAIGANPVWQLFGYDGLKAEGLKDYRPEDDIAYFLRPGGHGVTRTDVAAILAFADDVFAQRELLISAMPEDMPVAPNAGLP
ncbi:MAG: hypothetical protein AAFX02_06950 [Pseudomonadota bacterium]